MPKFSVTYEIYTPESIECGDAEERGFISEDVSLADAVRDLGGHADAADEWPVRKPRWFTNDDYDTDYHSGRSESRSLHIPETVTPASRRRIARLLGVRL